MAGCIKCRHRALRCLEGLPKGLLRRVQAKWERGHPELRTDMGQYQIHDWMNAACDALAYRRYCWAI
jgi:hypothetical protein